MSKPLERPAWGLFGCESDFYNHSDTQMSQYPCSVSLVIVRSIILGQAQPNLPHRLSNGFDRLSQACGIQSCHIGLGAQGWQHRSWP